MSLVDDPFHMNRTFRGNLAIIHSIPLDKATKVIHDNFRIIINGVTNLLRYLQCIN